MASLHDRPHRFDEATVVEEQPVVPDTHRDVGDGVGVEFVLLDGIGQVVLVPRAISALDGRQPVEGALGIVAAPAERESHRRFDVVPRVGVPTREPRDHAVRQLPLRDGIDGGRDLGATEYTADFRHSHD